MTRPNIPNVKAATWRHPYRFSGKLPFGALLLMVVVGFLSALVAGYAGYFGGAVTSWILIQTTHLVTGIAKWLAGRDAIGIGIAYALVILPTLIIGFLYPGLIGMIAASGVFVGALVGKCRMPYFAGLLGFLAGGAAYATFVWTALFIKAPLHVSSRILPLVGPPLSYVLMVVDCLIVLIAATSLIRSLYKTPFCESCGKWFDSGKLFASPKTLTIRVSDAALLIEALASRSALPLQGVPVGTSAPARIRLDLSRCDCGQSDYNLVAVLHWNEDKKGKAEAKTQTWFITTLPTSLGIELERWSTSTPGKEQNEKVNQLTLKPQEAVPLHTVDHSQTVAAAPSRATAQPTQQVSNSEMEICKRCGRTINTSTRLDYTCPHCGHTQWGIVIGMGVFSMACMGTAIFMGANISASFWRQIVMWGGGILGD